MEEIKMFSVAKDKNICKNLKVEYKENKWNQY